MSDVVLQIPEDLAQHARQLSKDEVGILITLFSLTDKWPTGTASDELQKSHAQVLRWHLQSLFDYYYALSQENKAKLVTTLPQFNLPKGLSMGRLLASENCV